ncbi:MAG: tRNA uridine-5-carboxymethylaminomethyl(34) synthesis GTPase MnmE [Planctomycetota bacterium]|jgi:tRNA modification GTPase
MVNTDDTIAAVSSAAVPAGAPARSIIRVCGPDTYQVLSRVLTTPQPIEKNRIAPCTIRIDDDLAVDGLIYAFFQPHSYTGQDLAEIHLDTCATVVEAVLEKIYQYVRPAAPGEFTQRAFLNGRMDLMQAEAVAEIVSAANTTQLVAAERLLGGRFTEVITGLRSEIVELIGNLEAGLDFSEEDIEFVSAEMAVVKVDSLKKRLSELLDSNVRCERMIDLDSVGLAGAPNAGKSSLLNALLGKTRSIVSETEATTRDVLTGILTLEHTDCVLFDCAGLLTAQKQTTLIDQLSHQASLEALNNAAVVLFCVDISKDDISVDLAMRQQISADNIVYVATKSDSVATSGIASRLERLQRDFDDEFLLISSQQNEGLSRLKNSIESKLAALRAGDKDHQDRLTLNQRHEQRLRDAVKILGESADEISGRSPEIAAMLLRQSYELLGSLEHENISETVLDSIFSRFCIGK